MKKPHEELYNILKKRGFSSFQIKVYKTVSSIPRGETKSYKWVACMVDRPQAQRAVGHALKRNPFPIIIPCHRVIRQNGTLGGFSCGKGLKKRLLELEKADIIKQTHG